VPDKIVKRRLGHSLRASKLFGQTPIVWRDPPQRAGDMPREPETLAMVRELAARDRCPTLLLLGCWSYLPERGCNIQDWLLPVLNPARRRY